VTRSAACEQRAALFTDSRQRGRAGSARSCALNRFDVRPRLCRGLYLTHSFSEKSPSMGGAYRLHLFLQLELLAFQPAHRCGIRRGPAHFRRQRCIKLGMAGIQAGEMSIIQAVAHRAFSLDRGCRGYGVQPDNGLRHKPRRLSTGFPVIPAVM
jgi:hypothetical protein